MLCKTKTFILDAINRFTALHRIISHIYIFRTHFQANTTVQNFGVVKIFFYAHQNYIYFNKNTLNIQYYCEILLQFNNAMLLLLQILFIPVTSKLNLQQPLLQSVTWSLRNHSNMLICCSRNIYNYLQCWKPVSCLIEETMIHFSCFFFF